MENRRAYREEKEDERKVKTDAKQEILMKGVQMVSKGIKKILFRLRDPLIQEILQE